MPDELIPAARLSLHAGNPIACDCGHLCAGAVVVAAEDPLQPDTVVCWDCAAVAFRWYLDAKAAARRVRAEMAAAASDPSCERCGGRASGGVCTECGEHVPTPRIPNT